ncbi:thiamine-binding protein [Prolixibacteraceae bacterium]|uniref:thiamine-binding protein n=1 Tax=Halosquirtibacter xylanolyticus TaxID=3374599 RepID=UPI00374A9562|nr:thiamine-binding protein [Prolixibacteraceae bacterium]QZT38365.1 thiamine-binding protein [Prolixibacteraceae bacterium]
MNHTVNVAVQVLPRSKDVDTYDLVDEAISIIDQSGIKYRVTPFETVMEGDYDQIMEIVKKIQLACYKAGAETAMTYVKIQTSSLSPVRIDDKMKKYD